MPRKLTDDWCKKAKLGTDIGDSLMRGLRFKVSSLTGRRTFYERRGAGGKGGKTTLGVFPVMGVPDARREKMRRDLERARGNDPTPLRPEPQEEASPESYTVRMMWDDFMRKGGVIRPWRPKTRRENRRTGEAEIISRWETVRHPRSSVVRLSMHATPSVGALRIWLIGLCRPYRRRSTTRSNGRRYQPTSQRV